MKKAIAFAEQNPVLVGGALLLGAVGLWIALRGVKGVARDVVSGAGSVATGAVEGVGLVLGVPLTNQTQCQQDLAAGNYWAASASCPAGDFIGGLFSSKP